MSKSYRPLPPVEELRRLFTYEPETGHLYWNVRRSGTKTAAPAGSVNCRYGHIQVCLGGRNYRAHRIAWAITTGEDPGPLTIDHIDRNPANNKWENLRLATTQQQSRNTRKPNKHGLKGVAYYERSRRPWRATIKAEGKRHILGYYATKEEAYAAYCAAAARFFGEFSSEPAL
jgi:hypothetical protein